MVKSLCVQVFEIRHENGSEMGIKKLRWIKRKSTTNDQPTEFLNCMYIYEPEGGKPLIPIYKKREWGRGISQFRKEDFTQS